MLINNPVYTMRFIDLLDMYKDNFTYEDLYKVVGEWLSTEQKYFVNADVVLWDKFIEGLCDRYYSRNINFDTTLDFKLKLRDTLRKYHNQAERVLEVSMLSINPLSDYKHTTKRTEVTEGNSTAQSVTNTSSRGESSTDVTDESSNRATNINESTAYNLHSDTPSNAVNINDLFSVAKNYVTDAANNKNSGNSTSTNTAQGTSKSVNSSSSDSDSINDNTNEYSNSSTYTELSEGYNGNVVELISKYMELVTDVVQFYLDAIENECLFSCVLY